MVVRAISGLIGGLIISLFFILSIGDLSIITDLISAQIGAIGENILIKVYIVFNSH